MANTYQFSTVSSLAGVVTALSSFASSQGWTVDTSTPAEPVFTLPTTDTLIDWKITTFTDTGYREGLEVSADGSAIPTSTLRVYSPQVGPTTAAYVPTVPDPTGVHMFITPEDIGVNENPSLAAVIEYPDATYRHLYLGRLVSND